MIVTSSIGVNEIFESEISAHSDDNTEDVWCKAYKKKMK
jgi:hypothetical protein